MNKMKRFLTVIVSACMVAAALSSTVAFADGERVVTLGADLDDEQRQMILKYFGISGETLETLTITNDDEREHLGAYVPLEQIGTRTYSCAYVNPTSSGGIQVKTANLTWVTSNMIASTLSTSGVVNCDVLAAAPFAVSGTGALTGVIMAYESASGETLDTQKKDVANQELVTTATIGDSVGQDMATLIVNEAKEEVIEGDVIDTGDITNIVNNITVENNVTLSEDDTDLLISLLEQISQLDYDIDDMKETLDRVEDNVSAQLDGTTDTDSDSGTVDDDSILKNTDDSALGDDANINATDPTTVETEESEPSSTDQTEDDSGLQIVVSDTYNSNDDGSDEGEEPADEEEPDASALVEDLGPVDLDEDDGDLDTANSDNEEDNDSEGSGLLDSIMNIFGASDDTDEEADVGTMEDAGEDVMEDAGEGEEDQESTLFEADLTMNPESSVNPGLNVLSVSVDQDGVTAGSGSVTVYTSDGSPVDSIAMDDSSSVASNGYEFDIYLDTPLAAGTSYYAVLSDDALEQNGAPMAATDGSDWTFSTASLGIGVMESVYGLSAGSTANGNVYIDPSYAGYAVIDSVTVDGADVTDLAAISQSEFTDNGSFQVTFPQSGQATIHVTYYDSADAMNYVDEASCSVSVW